jgi:hypothetical protein
MHPQITECAKIRNGGVAERLKAAVLKTVRLERVSGVRIPPPPPVFIKLGTWEFLHFRLE